MIEIIGLAASVVGLITGAWFLLDQGSSLTKKWLKVGRRYYPDELVTAIVNQPYLAEPANEDDIAWIATRTTELHGQNAVPYDIKLEWYKKNPFAFFVVRNNIGNLVGCNILIPVIDQVIKDLIAGKTREHDKRAVDIFSPEDGGLANYAYYENVMAIEIDGNPNVWAFKAAMDGLPRQLKLLNLRADCEIYAQAAIVFNTKNGLRKSNAAELMEKAGFERVVAKTRQNLPVYRTSVIAFRDRLKNLRRNRGRKG